MLHLNLHAPMHLTRCGSQTTVRLYCEADLA